MNTTFFRLLAVGLSLSVFLTGCEFSINKDPFEREEVVRKTLSGEVFSFDISVATEATHRLEKGGRLVALMASDIIPLDQFVGREVEVNGVYKMEKMREIFWVESIQLLSLTQEETAEKTEERFSGKDFTFIFPASWEYSTAPDGTAYFSDKEDPARRVFLKFSVGELTKEDKKLDPNVLIANLSGHKKANNDSLKREEETITLFSNVNDARKYTFYFVTQFEEFDKKKAFFALLNSFIEGEDEVKRQREIDLQEQAEKILEKVKEEEERKRLEELQASVNNGEIEPEENEDDGLLTRIVEKIKTEESEDESFDDIAEEVVEELAEEEEQKKWAFENLIDGRAYAYTSKGLKFSMKVPFGFWFVNYGAVDGKLGVIGMAKQELGSLADADIQLEIVQKEGGVDGKKIDFTPTGEMVVSFPRPGFENSYFQLIGSKEFRNAMLSVHSTISGN